MNLFNRKSYFRYTPEGWAIISKNYRKLFEYDQSVHEHIPSEAIKEILTNEDLYKYCLDCIGHRNINIKFISIQSLSNTRVIYNYNKHLFIKSLKEIPKEEINETQLKRLNALISTATPEYFFETQFDKALYPNITIRDIFRLMIKPENDFVKSISNNPLNLSISELTKILTSEPFNLKFENKKNFQRDPYILSAPIKDKIPFYESYSLKEGYVIEKNFEVLYKRNALMQEYLNGVTELQIINYFSQKNLIFDAQNTLGIDNETLAKAFKTTPLIPDLSKECLDNIKRFIFEFERDVIPNEKLEKPPLAYIKEAKLNEDFKNGILSEIPKYFTDAQRIYYIYRRVCEKLSYDDEYFSGDQKRMFSINHLDLNRIQEINEDNHLVICWESTLILAKFCEHLNIPFVIESNYGLSYGAGHTSLYIFCDGFAFSADSASDLAAEKNQNRVKMFSVENTAERKFVEFSKLKKVVDDFIEENKINIKFLNAKDVFDNIYKDSCPDITTEERFNIFLSVFDKINLEIMDAIDYIVAITKKTYEEEKNGYWKVEFVANNCPVNLDKQISLVTLIYYSPTYQQDKDENNFVYYIVEENIKRGPYTPKYISELFDSKQLTMIREQSLPGVSFRKEERNTDENYRPFKRN